MGFFRVSQAEQLISIINENYQLSSNFVGVGAVFEWVMGTKLKAPEFIANLGLEWLLRLLKNQEDCL